jgi:hypothetical protein
VSIKSRVGWALLNKHLKCTGAYGTYEIPKLSSFTCRWVGRYPTSLWMLYGIVSGHPRCVRWAYAWKIALGEVEPGPTLWPCRELLPLVVPSRHACVMLSGLYPCKVDYWFECPRHPRTWVMACSLCSNVVIELYLWFIRLMRWILLMILAYIKLAWLQLHA